MSTDVSWWAWIIMGASEQVAAHSLWTTFVLTGDAAVITKRRTKSRHVPLSSSLTMTAVCVCRFPRKDRECRQCYIPYATCINLGGTSCLCRVVSFQDGTRQGSACGGDLREDDAHGRHRVQARLPLQGGQPQQPACKAVSHSS